MVEGMQPFEGVRVIDMTHVLAGPFATYQLAVFGAEVIKIEHPDDPDQTRIDGVDKELSDQKIGTHFIIQNANKKSLTLNLKTEAGREVLRKLVATADILVENYRPGAMIDLGLGYEDMRKINPTLIYSSMSAFGQNGPRGPQTAYDQVIQAVSGLMLINGTEDMVPMKVGPPAVDYATGAIGAFALAAALFQRQRTGLGQYIDLAMLDTNLILLGLNLTNFSRSGHEPRARGNDYDFATVGLYDTKQGKLQIAAINLRQQKRLWALLAHPELIKTDNDARRSDADNERAVLLPILKEKTAVEWEDYFQANHIPAARVWSLPETMRHDHMKFRKIIHEFDDAPGIPGKISVPMSAFDLEHGGPEITSPPPGFGEHNSELLRELGYSDDEITALGNEGVI